MKKLWIILGRIAFIPVWLIGRIYLPLGGPRTRVIVMSQNRILLVKDWLGDGRWKLPGGGLHKSEAPLGGALRELREETGLSLPAKQLSLLGELAGKRYQPKIICFKAELNELAGIKPGYPEIIAAHWLPIDKLKQQIVSGSEIHRVLTTWHIGGF